MKTNLDVINVKYFMMMKNKFFEEIVYANGVPCYHKGCVNHVTHPCETCGRKQAKGEWVCYKNLKIIHEVSDEGERDYSQITRAIEKLY